MSMKFNGTDINTIYFNGTKLDKVYFNGILVFVNSYKRRLMVGDELPEFTNLYFDFPEGYHNQITANKTVLTINTKTQSESNYTKTVHIGDRINSPYKFVGFAQNEGSLLGDLNGPYSYDSSTQEEYNISSDYIYEDWKINSIVDCPTYRHIYVEDPNIRPFEVGDLITPNTRFYFSIPESLLSFYTALANLSVVENPPVGFKLATPDTHNNYTHMNIRVKVTSWTQSSTSGIYYINLEGNWLYNTSGTSGNGGSHVSYTFAQSVANTGAYDKSNKIVLEPPKLSQNLSTLLGSDFKNLTASDKNGEVTYINTKHPAYNYILVDTRTLCNPRPLRVGDILKKSTTNILCNFTTEFFKEQFDFIRSCENPTDAWSEISLTFATFKDSDGTRYDGVVRYSPEHDNYVIQIEEFGDTGIPLRIVIYNNVRSTTGYPTEVVGIKTLTKQLTVTAIYNEEFVTEHLQVDASTL